MSKKIKSLRLLTYVLTTMILLSASALRAAAYVIIDDMEVVGQWNGTKDESIGAAVGEGCLCFEANNDVIIANVNFPETDISEIENVGFLHLMIYVPDDELLIGNGQIELTSSGTCDVEEMHWPIEPWMFQKGWNTINLSINDVDRDEDFDIETVNFFRLYIFTSKPTFILIDDIAIGSRSELALMTGRHETDAETEREVDFETDENGNVVNNNPIYGGIEGGGSAENDDGGTPSYIYLIILTFSFIGIVIIYIMLKRKAKDGITEGETAK